MCGLLSIFIKFLSDDDLLQIVQSIFGLVIIFFIKIMFYLFEKIFYLISSVFFCFVDCISVFEWFMNSCRSFCCGNVFGLVVLFLCQGIFVMLDWQNGSMGWSGEVFFLDIVYVLFILSLQIKELMLEMFLLRIMVFWINLVI